MLYVLDLAIDNNELLLYYILLLEILKYEDWEKTKSKKIGK